MTQVLERVDIDPITGSSRAAHIVKPVEGQSASALILEARIYGIEVEALCGYRWVPSRDPKNYPVCDKCKEIWDLMKLDGSYRNEY